LVAQRKRRPPRKAAATKARKNKEGGVKPPLREEMAHGAAGGRCEAKRGHLKVAATVELTGVAGDLIFKDYLVRIGARLVVVRGILRFTGPKKAA